MYWNIPVEISSRLIYCFDMSWSVNQWYSENRSLTMAEVHGDRGGNLLRCARPASPIATNGSHIFMNNSLNRIYRNIKFTLETEAINATNYLDLKISKNDWKLTLAYTVSLLQPTKLFFHISPPLNQTLAAYNSFVHSLLSVPLNLSDHNNEVQLMKHIAVSNDTEVPWSTNWFQTTKGTI